MIVIPPGDLDLATAAEAMIGQLEVCLLAVEKLITPSSVSQPRLMHSQVGFPYWRNAILISFSETSGTPNYGTPFRRLTFDVNAICLVGNAQAEGIETRARRIQIIGALQFQRRPALQSPTFPQGYRAIDADALERGIFRGAALNTLEESGGALIAAVFRLQIPIIYENEEE